MSKDQINLPKTVFSMKANLPAKEPNLVKYWDEIKLYETLRKRLRVRKSLYFTMALHMQTEIFIWVLHLIKF